MPVDYLFTWKSDKWPYEKLRVLVDEFSAGKEVTEPWRVAAHKKIRPGDSAYIFKQGDQPRGIFAVGTITGTAIENSEAMPGESRWQVPITFRILVDPTQQLLVSEEQLLAMPAPDHRWRTQGSGVHLEYDAARAIDAAIELARGSSLLSPTAADNSDFDAGSVEDARERINRSIVIRRGQTAFRAKLLNAYKNQCAVTGCDVEDLLEAAHIVPYKGPQTNYVQNGLLLRSDIHTLFDCGLLTIDPVKMTLILSPRLMRSSYRVLAGKVIRLPNSLTERPDATALARHRESTGL